MERKWFKRSLLGFGVFTALIIGFGLYFSVNPTLLLNEANLSRIANLLESEKRSIDWKSARIEIENITFLRKKIALRLEQACFKNAPQIQELCFEEINIEGQYRLSLEGVQIESLGPILLKDGSMHYRVVSNQNSEPLTEIPIPNLELPTFLKTAVLKSIQINLNKVHILTANAEYQAKAELKSSSAPVQGLGDIHFSAEIDAVGEKRKLLLTTSLSSASHFMEDDWQATHELSIRSLDQGLFEALVHFNKNAPDVLAYGIDVSLDLKKLRSKGSIRGLLGSDQLSAEISKQVHFKEYPLSVELKDCHLFSKQGDSFGEEDASGLECHVTGKTSNKTVQHLNQERIELEIKAELASFITRMNEDLIVGDLNVFLLPLASEKYQISGGISSQFSGKLLDPIHLWKIHSKYHVIANILGFEKLVEHFDSTALAIPAPFNSLTGPADISIQGTIEEITQDGDLKFSLNTHLKSATQRLISSSSGVLFLDLKESPPKLNSVSLNVEIEDALIELPTLNLINLPTLAPDERFQSPPENQIIRSEKFPLNLTLKTMEKDSFKLATHLLKNPIPFGFNVHVKDSIVAGDIQTDPFDFELFRRKAAIEAMEIQLRTPTSDSEVNGRIRIDDLDYKIYISLKGTFERPTVLFDSDPYLTEEDIIAVLLYGEPYTSLDMEQADSVGNLNASLANKAISMFSLFLLGSSPIQRVGYDPYTQTFSAKLRLGEKTSASIGSAGKNQKISLRRRLGKGWGVSTTVANPADKLKTEGSALIDWQKRY